MHPFVDLEGQSEAVNQAVGMIYREGITEGTSATTFSPDEPVTRGQMAVFLVRTMKVLGHVFPEPEPGPTVEITEPTASELTGSFWFRAVSPEAVQVDLFVDDVLVKSDTSDPYVTAVDSTLFADGEHTLRAVARDADGNEATVSKAVNIASEPGPPGDVLWTGSRVDDWYSTAHSGGGESDDVTIDGQPAVRLSLPASGQGSSGARLNHQGFGPDRVLPAEAWYEVDYLIPEFLPFQDLIFQFKQGDGSTRRHLWNVGVDSEGRFIIRDRINPDGTWRSSPEKVATLGQAPVGEWFRLRTFRRTSESSDGLLIVEVNGTEVWRREGPNRASDLTPRPQGDNEWVVAHYYGSWQSGYPASETFVRNARITT